MKLLRVYNSETIIEIPYERIRKDLAHDVAYTSFDNIYQFDISTTEPEDMEITKYRLAQDLPEVGDNIFLVGFPSNEISHKKPFKVKC